jgi:hypothetical protein
MMNRRPRHLLIWLMTLCLSLGSVFQGAVQARGLNARAGSTELVICSGTGGTLTILVDDEGRPVAPDKTTPRKACPECLAADGLGLAPRMSTLQHATPVALRHLIARAELPDSPRFLAAAARGPPSEA